MSSLLILLSLLINYLLVFHCVQDMPKVQLLRLIIIIIIHWIIIYRGIPALLKWENPKTISVSQYNRKIGGPSSEDPQKRKIWTDRAGVIYSLQAYIGSEHKVNGKIITEGQQRRKHAVVLLMSYTEVLGAHDDPTSEEDDQRYVPWLTAGLYRSHDGI